MNDCPRQNPAYGHLKLFPCDQIGICPELFSGPVAFYKMFLIARIYFNFICQFFDKKTVLTKPLIHFLPSFAKRR